MQVGIWAAAQFTKLEQLATEANEISGKNDGVVPELPFLPLIIIQGHDWIFLAAVRDPGKQTVRFPPPPSLLLVLIKFTSYNSSFPNSRRVFVLSASIKK